MSLLENLPHRCTIRRRTRRGDGMVGNKTTVTVVATNVPCWQQAAGDREVRTYAQKGMSITHKIYFAADPQITANDEILITSRDAGATVLARQPVLEVRSSAGPDAGAGLGVLYRVMCEESTATEA